MDGNKATVYYTNAEGNNVYLKLRVLDENDNILGETGLLKPGEYVRDVELIQALSADTGIRLKIMSYAPDTYLSEGSVVLNTTIGTAPRKGSNVFVCRENRFWTKRQTNKKQSRKRRIWCLLGTAFAVSLSYRNSKM